MLALQLKNRQPLGKEELAETFLVNTAGEAELSAITAWLQNPR